MSTNSPPIEVPHSASGVLSKLRKAHLPEPLRAELVEVYTHLSETVQDLRYPLNELLAREIEQIYPFTSASVVLTVGVSETEPKELRQRRIYLASALEMLRVALSIHKTLLVHTEAPSSTESKAEASPAEQNKSLIGSVILAGDYCFSRSAHMAAQTDDPVVVALFAQALKELSEAHLRQVFDSEGQGVTEHQILFRSGVETAARLADLTPEALSQNREISHRLAQAMDGNPSVDRSATIPADIPSSQYERWRYVLPWLLDSHDS